MTKFGPFKLENWSIKRILILAVVVHVVTALNSEGFFQFDEHFQILEFISYKLNSTSSADLPWEFKSQIRPWFQVLLYYLILVPIKFVGISSPFAQATILRVLTGLIGILAVFSLKDFLGKDESKIKIYFFFLLFSWFVPVIHVRASSENLSASFILIGFSFLMGALKKDNFLKGMLAGLFLGFGYLVKSQLALVVAFLWFWLLIFHPKKWKVSLSSSLSILFTIGLGIIIDYWGYGEWTFSTLNYFKVNIIENRVSNFGIDPWWYYFKLTFMKGIPILSIPFLFASFIYWKRFWKSPITWMTAPFFLIHCLIGHKELRFIFFIVLLSPLMLTVILTEYQMLRAKWVKVFIFINLIVMVLVAFKSANSSIRFYKHIRSNQITQFQAHGENPFTMVGLRMNYYYPENLVVSVFKETPLSEGGYLFFKTGKKYFEYSLKSNCQLDYISYPTWSLKFNYFNWIERSRVWSLWKCSN
jgi:phosphatidylinositol glycan class B